MAVTSGFFNSLNGDRKYSAEQFSALFDNLITDGVFANVGTAFGVTASGDNTVTVGIGRAWFNSVWVYNDALYPMVAQDPEVLLDRIDAIVIEINHNESVRSGSIRWVYGSPGSSPVRPTLTNTDVVHQYPLAYVRRKAGVSAVIQADITNMIGMSECPYVTGILSTQSIDKVVAQWESQFYTWFDGLDTALEGDVAANLANQVLDIQSRFQTLAREKAVYEELQDSTGAKIQDNNGGDILGKTYLGVSDDMIINYNPPQAGGDETDGFEVGDILTTLRTDLGPEWHLCNGEVVSRSAYSKLSDVFQPDMAYGSIEQILDEVEDTGEDSLGYKIRYLNGYYFTFYDTDKRNVLRYSTSIHGPWSEVEVNSSTLFYLQDIAYYNGKYIVVAGRQTSSSSSSYYIEVAHSESLSGPWSVVRLENNSFSSPFVNIKGYGRSIVAGDNAIIVATMIDDRGRQLYIYRSTDGLSWTKYESITGAYSRNYICHLYDLSYENGYFIASLGYTPNFSSDEGIRSWFAYSSDGISWSLTSLHQDSTTPMQNHDAGCYGVRYVDGKYVAFGVISPDDLGFKVYNNLNDENPETVIFPSSVIPHSYDDGLLFGYEEGVFFVNYYSTVYFATDYHNDWTGLNVFSGAEYGDEATAYVKTNEGYAFRKDLYRYTSFIDIRSITLPTISTEGAFDYIKVSD